MYRRTADVPPRKIRAALRDAFSRSGADKRIELTVRVPYEGFGDASYSLLVFRTRQEPGFLTGSSLVDTIHGFVLLLEVGQFAALLSKHAGSTNDLLPGEYERLPYGDVVSLFGGDDAAYQSVALRTLGGGKHGLLGKSFHAADLTGVMPRAGSRRSSPTSIKVKSGDRVARLAPGTGRVSRQGGREPLANLFLFAAEVSDELGARRSSPFLRAFAEPIRVEDLPSDVEPASVLLHWGEVQDALEDGDLRVEAGGGEWIAATGDDVAALSNVLTEQLSVSANDDGTYTVVDEQLTNVGRLRRLKTKFSIESSTLRRYALVDSGVDRTLDQLISAQELFTVSFTNPEFSYSGSTLLRNRDLPEEITSFLGCFRQLPALSQTTTEKGALTQASTIFGHTSVFDVIERYVLTTFPDAALICDDLDAEWADHIVLQNDAARPSIEFVHSKWRALGSMSASAFQDVTGQAIKNIGNLGIDTERFADRCYGKWSRLYTDGQGGGTTQIARIRSQHAPSDCAGLHRTIRGSANHSMIMSIAAPYVSRVALAAAADDIASRQRVKDNVVQLFWILAGFIDNCRQNNVEPRVYCAP